MDATPGPAEGNHIIVGGAKPADSPMLRNPGLLRSLVGYFGTIIQRFLTCSAACLWGRRSFQAPRVDEARETIKSTSLKLLFAKFPNMDPVRHG